MANPKLSINQPSLRIEDLPEMLTSKQMMSFFGISYVTLWRRTKGGEFPLPIEISARAKRWRKATLIAWLDAKEVA